jgi:hypothetical protein
VRFEVPSAYRTLRRVVVRVARWDLSSIELVDPRTEERLCDLYPQDKRQNADRRRRVLAPVVGGSASDDAADGDDNSAGATDNTGEPAPQRAESPGARSVAPYVAELMADSANSTAPAYLPLTENLEAGAQDRESDDDRDPEDNRDHNPDNRDHNPDNDDHNPEMETSI